MLFSFDFAITYLFVFLQHISNYLIAEHEVKQGSLLDLIDWRVQNIKVIKHFIVMC